MNVLYRLSALLLFILFLPLFFILYLLVKFDSSGPFIFRQKRMGKDRKVFTLYKIRTMVKNAQKQKQQYLSLNEADGPVFKIRRDPRHTKIGRFLAHTGLDELSQLINVLKGEMLYVGPRPLPVDEAKKIPAKYAKRFSVLPGMTSLWVIRGSHSLTFAEWMESDLEYIRKKTLWLDIKIIALTVWRLIS
jgi:lipopolysaccharide/colanic/teichoic acid biosynthesis glycosyltransferase